MLILFAGIAVFYYLRYKRAPNIASEEIVMQNSAGGRVNLNDELSGNTVVHFYATWCGPCMAEMRTIKSHYAALSAKGLQFIFITDDSADKISRVQADMPQGIRFYHIPSLKEVDIYSIPTTYFFNTNKQITEKHLGAFAWTNHTEVDKVLAAMNR